MAALTAAQKNKVILIEKNDRIGKKLFITGKGRCNVTNASDGFFNSVVTNSKFMYSSFYTFDNNMIMDYLEKAGCPLKIERGGRVFPTSDHSSDVIGAFKTLINRNKNISLYLNTKVTGINIEDGRIKSVDVSGDNGGTGNDRIYCDAVIICTGGRSYPLTGSTGDGYRLAEHMGHTIKPLSPSLVPFEIEEKCCSMMMGLSLKNVALHISSGKKKIFDEQGEMLFTHFGISGPLTLSASSHLGDMKKHRYIAEIDLKPALSEEQLYDRITRDFALLANHAAQGALVKLLPSSMQPVMVARWGIDPATKANQITREQKRELVQLVKHWQVSIDARGDLAHAVITSGGVSVREVDPKTMQSKKALGLYFAGEVLDVDAYTGGYNLQIAFCTAQSFANNL